MSELILVHIHQPPQPLTARERRARALLAMCIAAPQEGREVLEHIDPSWLGEGAIRRAHRWVLRYLRTGHRVQPAAIRLDSTTRADEELVALAVELTMRAERERPTREAMQLNAWQLEVMAIDDEIVNLEAHRIGLEMRRAELDKSLASYGSSDRPTAPPTTAG